MRLLPLVAVASLVLATPGCTLIGAGIGASIPVSNANPGDSAPPNHNARAIHTLLGATMGFVIDSIIAVVVINELNKPLFPGGFCICD